MNCMLFLSENEWVASILILVFAQRFLGWPLGKHCKLLEGNIWRKVVSTFENDFRERSTLFYRTFIISGCRWCLYEGSVRFFFRITVKYIIKYINKPRSLHVVNFTITIVHGEKLVGRFYHIDHGCSNKNLRFLVYACIFF